jgi:hypothetical protein
MAGTAGRLVRRGRDIGISASDLRTQLAAGRRRGNRHRQRQDGRWPQAALTCGARISAAVTAGQLTRQEDKVRALPARLDQELNEVTRAARPAARAAAARPQHDTAA